MTRGGIGEINLAQVHTSIPISNVITTAYTTRNPLFQQDLFLCIPDCFVVRDANVEAFREACPHTFLSSSDGISCILWTLPRPSLAQVDSLRIPTTPVGRDIAHWNGIFVVVLSRQTHIHTHQHQEARRDMPR